MALLVYQPVDNGVVSLSASATAQDPTQQCCQTGMALITGQSKTSICLPDSFLTNHYHTNLTFGIVIREDTTKQFPKFQGSIFNGLFCKHFKLASLQIHKNLKINNFAHLFCFEARYIDKTYNTSTRQNKQPMATAYHSFTVPGSVG